jgi:membrane-bound serine protease (ClpP class)
MSRLVRRCGVTVLCAFLLASLTVTAIQAATPRVLVLTIKGIINPVMADYLARGIGQAEKTGAEVCVVQLDTPGGLDTSMRDMVQSIVNSTVPVVVFVSPSGARAASAGVFITMSAHVAAMAPDTNIGAASPVSLGASGVENVPSTEEQKVMNDAAAFIRSLAAAHGRNADWAEQTVRQAVSATEQEALDLDAIELIAPDLNSLLKQIDGKHVSLIDGTEVTLSTASAAVSDLDMTWIEKFLLAISDPNIAFTLMGLAGIGLWVEITNPGLVFPGVFGGISLIFALFSLGNLPVNIAGILLIVLAFILFVVEALVIPGFGAAGIGGIVSLVFGALILFKGGPMFRVNPWIVAIVAICFAAFLAFIVFKLTAARKLKPKTGAEELIGEMGTVRVPLDPEGVIFRRGELWSAASEEGRIEAGETVIIKRIDGLKLFVSKTKKEGN